MMADERRIKQMIEDLYREEAEDARMSGEEIHTPESYSYLSVPLSPEAVALQVAAAEAWAYELDALEPEVRDAAIAMSEDVRRRFTRALLYGD